MTRKASQTDGIQRDRFRELATSSPARSEKQRQMEAQAVQLTARCRDLTPTARQAPLTLDPERRALFVLPLRVRSRRAILRHLLENLLPRSIDDDEAHAQ